jgi:hypothetical protein
LLARHDFQIRRQLRGPGPTMCLQQADDCTRAALLAAVQLLERGVRLTDPGAMPR